MSKRRCTHHQCAIRYGVTHCGILARIFHHLMRLDGGLGFPKRDLVGMDYAELKKSEIAHRSGRRADVERIARCDQNDFEGIHGLGWGASASRWFESR